MYYYNNNNCQAANPYQPPQGNNGNYYDAYDYNGAGGQNAHSQYNYNYDYGGDDTFSPSAKREDEFTFGLCTCCSRGSGFCCEAYCCYYCNLTRQCSMAYNGQFEDSNYLCCCVLLWLGDFCLSGNAWSCIGGGGFVSFIVSCLTRNKTRERFGLKGNMCLDCCAAWWCSWCIIQQMMGEYMARQYQYPTSWTCSDPWPTEGKME